MNDQLARSLFMDYLYDEISAKDKERLESYLETRPSLQAELEKLQQTRNLLQQLPAGEPDRKLLVMEPGKRSFSQWWKEAQNLMPQTLWGKSGFAFAASLILLMLIGSVAKVHVASTDSGYSISLGYQPVVNEGLSARQAEALIHQIRQENAAMLDEYAETLQQQNRQQLQQLVQYVDQQRLQDLQLIDYNLDQVQQANSYRWQEANRFLGEVLQNISLNENN
ncbi:MAG: hypothetical protein GVY02_06710 [Bacteroidetes bacterium]|jgi:hypothetical protein|nr:hypothetical protein [Bacteroidota bacterium]